MHSSPTKARESHHVKSEHSATNAANGHRVYSNKFMTAGSSEKIRARDLGMHLANETRPSHYRSHARSLPVRGCCTMMKPVMTRIARAIAVLSRTRDCQNKSAFARYYGGSPDPRRTLCIRSASLHMATLDHAGDRICWLRKAVLGN